MNLICFNQKYCIFSSQTQTHLVEIPAFTIKATLYTKLKTASLQYGTGIAALAHQSKVRIYDFIMEKDVYNFESHLKIEKIGIMKNLLIIISAQRILIHDLKTKENQCYIPIQDGSFAFMSKDYYNLSIAYYIESHLLASRKIWLNSITKIEGIKYSLGVYSNDAKFIALALKNMLSIYDESELVRVYGFDFNIQEIVLLKNYFFVKLDNNQIIGCNQENQMHFQEWEEIAVNWWDQQYETCLVADNQSLYLIGKGIIKRTRFDRAQICKTADTKDIKKEKESSM